MDEELYTNIVYTLINGLKNHVTLDIIDIGYDNIEIIIYGIDGKNINQGDFSISFQKQNGSFTIITKNNLNEKIKKQIIDIVNNFTNTEIFASYNFSDMMNINVDHYVYDDSKKEFNKNILNEFKKLDQIKNLKINEPKTIIK